MRGREGEGHDGGHSAVHSYASQSLARGVVAPSRRKHSSADGNGRQDDVSEGEPVLLRYTLVIYFLCLLTTDVTG